MGSHVVWLMELGWVVHSEVAGLWVLIAWRVVMEIGGRRGNGKGAKVIRGE